MLGWPKSSVVLAHLVTAGKLLAVQSSVGFCSAVQHTTKSVNTRRANHKTNYCALNIPHAHIFQSICALVEGPI